MAGRSSPIPPRQAALRVVAALRRAGHVACLAGGCVRDELLGLTPTDYDVATDATPGRVEALFARTQSVGASFGVVLVREGGAVIEVATFRADGPYTDKRRPDEIRFSDPSSDAHRRDFTINALFLDPPEAGAVAGGEAFAGARIEESPAGRVIDFVGGLDDLALGVIRAVGDADQRLAEDHLRALRAVRLMARLGMTLDPATGEAISAHAGELRGVSCERIGEEVRKMLCHPSRVVAAWTLQVLGLDAPVLGEASVVSAPVRLGRLGDDASYPLSLAAWALDRGRVIEATQIRPLVLGWRRSLCLSNDEKARLEAILTGHATLARAWWSLGVAGQKRAAASAWFDDAMRLIRTTSNEEFVRIARRVSELRCTPSGLSPAVLVSGDDLIRAGLEPGPAFRSLLDRVYDAQLEDRITTQQQGVALAMELAREQGV